MPNCSKYHAKWQVLVPNCCKYKANGTRKENQTNSKTSEEIPVGWLLVLDLFSDQATGRFQQEIHGYPLWGKWSFLMWLIMHFNGLMTDGEPHPTRRGANLGVPSGPSRCRKDSACWGGSENLDWTNLGTVNCPGCEIMRKRMTDGMWNVWNGWETPMVLWSFPTIQTPQGSNSNRIRWRDEFTCARACQGWGEGMVRYG